MHYCNPINVDYKYQFIRPNPVFAGPDAPAIQISREAADPSMILFQGRYYIFASMTLSVWVSDDLVHWDLHPLPKELPLYDYAPDVTVVGDYVYFCASRRGVICDFYRTRDILHGPYEKIPGTFDFWDPALFVDDDGRFYFYYGCNNTTPIYGVELDPATMKRIGETHELIYGDPFHLGYERNGENHSAPPRTEEEIEKALDEFLTQTGKDRSTVPEREIAGLKGLFSRMPFIEGAWMNKHNGRYYLQYACPGTEYNIYSNGVYESDSPLGPFHPAANNPYSYEPGGFLPGAGHGSTAEDRHGNLWHTASMRISVSHMFERRVGIWPAGFDKDGVLFCNQRYGDWPIRVEEGVLDPMAEPDYMLLSRGARVQASSEAAGHPAARVSEEDVQTFWKAASNRPGEWIRMDLGEALDVRGIQVNFADDKLDLPSPRPIPENEERCIDERRHVTRWILKGSCDGENYFVIADKSEAETNLPNDYVDMEEGVEVRYLKLTILEVPFGVQPCISGLRVFGKKNGELPRVPSYQAERTGDLDMTVTITSEDPLTDGYNVLWGFAPDKLYHSDRIFSGQAQIGALIKGQPVYVRVDAFSKTGITHGTEVISLP